MEVSHSQSNQDLKGETEEEPAEQHQKQQLFEVCKEIQEQLNRFKPQSLALFRQWVSRVYKFKINANDLRLETKNFECSISSCEMEKIINQVLVDTCWTHRSLMESQLRFIRQQASEYYKIDGDEPEIGYFQGLVVGSEGTKISHDWSWFPNSQFYSYCVWVIYNSYCSISQCNDIVCELVRIFHENSENIVYNLLEEIDQRKSTNKDYSFTGAKDNGNVVQHLVSMTHDEQLLQASHLNVLTIINIIPHSMLSASKSNPQHQQQDANKEADQNGESEEQEERSLHEHICIFETTINSIIYDNKQNMRRYVAFLRNFKKAIKVIKEKLSKSGRKTLQSDPQLLTDKKKAKRDKNLMKLQITEQAIFQDEVDKNMDLYRYLDDQFIVDDQRTKEDEAELVKSLQWYLDKSISISDQSQASRKLKISKQYELKQDIPDRSSLKNKKVASTFQFTSNSKNSFLESSEECLQSLVKISALKSRLLKVEKYKLEFLIRKNEAMANHRLEALEKQAIKQIEEKAEKLEKLENQEKQEKIQKSEKYNNSMRTDRVAEGKKKSPINYLDEFNQKRKKIDLQFSEQLHRNIVNSVGSNLSGLMRNSFLKEEEFANYMKLTQNQRNHKNQLFDDMDEDPGLQQYLQGAHFRDDDESEDEKYLDRMEQQKTEGQRKKKKKKNKKKKAVKDEKNDNNTDETSKTNDTAGDLSKTKLSIKNQVSPREYEIIKTLENTKIDLQNRFNCYAMTDALLFGMQKRQNDLLNTILSSCHQVQAQQEPRPKKSKLK